MPNPTNPLSACCQAYMTTQSDIEGTSYYTCDNCYEPCDQYIATNPNEAEEAERETSIEQEDWLEMLRYILKRHNSLSPQLIMQIKQWHIEASRTDCEAQKQKWVEEMDASFPTKHQLWVTAAGIVNADSEDHEDDEIIEPVFKLLEAIFAAWRAALRGERK